MKVKNELKYDFDLIGPKATMTDSAAVVENVREIVSIREDSVTVRAGNYFVTVAGSRLAVSEIWEGRMELEGEIRRIEFYRAQSTHKG